MNDFAKKKMTAGKVEFARKKRNTYMYLYKPRHLSIDKVGFNAQLIICLINQIQLDNMF